MGPRSEIVPHAEVLEVKWSSVIVRPQRGTLHSVPWAANGKYSIGEVLCELQWIPPYKDGCPQASCTRFMARTQLNRLEALGYKLLSGYEAEFFVYKCKDTQDDVTSRPLFHGCDIFTSLLQVAY